jgi:NADPH:quinone reductase-like Zn-dependent oxidoreductase
MKSWFIRSSPECTAVELRDVPVPEPKAGDRIMGRASGAYSEFALFRADYALPAPASLSWEEAAGAGVASVQLGNLIGAKVIGTSGSAEKLKNSAPSAWSWACGTATAASRRR